ncbi:MAG: 30S ribosomal protein S9 [Chloroflexota bacterium]|nr:30S ribosomal protein S9 [Chloroflexota bacterium]
MSDKSYIHATGRRKEAVAQVRFYSGGEAIVVNGRALEEMFPQERFRKTIMEPLVVTDNVDKFGITIKVKGGGNAGQAGAIRHGIARALVSVDEGHKTTLRSYGFLTRDSRVKERKKYGLVRARKAKQFSKR